jgi:hypothetical protein
MEHGLLMIRLLQTLTLALLCFSLPGGAADGRLVLVASAQSPIARISVEEERKLYLGIPLLVDGQPVQPVRNVTDPVTEEMFLQRIMFMSSQAYERQILGRVFRSGGNPPLVVTDKSELIRVLLDDRMAVTYMLREAAAATRGIKIVTEP